MKKLLTILATSIHFLSSAQSTLCKIRPNDYACYMLGNVTRDTLQLSRDSTMVGVSSMHELRYKKIVVKRLDNTHNDGSVTRIVHVGTDGSLKVSPISGMGFLVASDTTGHWKNVNYQPTWSSITSKPTTLSGFGITDPIVLTSGSYTNPSWIASFAYSKVTGTPTLAAVATSGAYSDLTGVPTIPTNTNQLTNGSGFITLSSVSATAPITYNNSTGVIATSGKVIDGTGTSAFNGVALQVQYTITHGFGFTPTYVFTQAKSLSAAVVAYVDNFTSTTFRVTFIAAPTAGVNNVVFDFIGLK